MPIGALPIGDVMLAQKIALETCEGEVRGGPADSLRTVSISDDLSTEADESRACATPLEAKGER
jgi:hypothetical protein